MRGKRRVGRARSGLPPALLEAPIHQSLTSLVQRNRMVIRRRWRAIVFPLILYAVSGSVTSYFVWHAVNGSRGLKTQDEYQAKMEELARELEDLRTERAGWERRVAMLRAEAVDRDLLEEQTRAMLGRVSKSDLVIMLPPSRKD